MIPEAPVPVHNGGFGIWFVITTIAVLMAIFSRRKGKMTGDSWFWTIISGLLFILLVKNC